jgi:hypothetical protein
MTCSGGLCINSRMAGLLVYTPFIDVSVEDVPRAELDVPCGQTRA